MKEFKYRHILLFAVTLIATTIAGAEWMYGRSLFFGDVKLTLNQVLSGLKYSIPFLLILTVHEFGHYFVAKHHKVSVTLPNYIPLWLGFLGLPSIGTMGAYIRIKDAIFSRKHYFDIGVAGPLAGFVVAMGVIWYGFTHLPPQEYIFEIHPEYEEYGLDYAQHVYEGKEGISIQLGNNIIYWFFENYVVSDTSRLPHPNEMIHYPYLLAGYLALFFTALNLLPIGQLDGGHVTFGLFGERISRKLNFLFFTAFIFYAGLGWIDPSMLPDVSIESSLFFAGIILVYIYFLYIATSSMFENRKNRLLYATVIFSLQYLLVTYTDIKGYGGWLLFAFLLGRFLGVYHPPVLDNRELSTGRKIVGWIAIVVFILSFSPRPLIIE